MAGEIIIKDPLSYSLEQLNSLPDEWGFEINRSDLSGLSLDVGIPRMRQLKAMLRHTHALGYAYQVAENPSGDSYAYQFKRLKRSLPETNINPDIIDI